MEASSRGVGLERRTSSSSSRPHKDQILNCPRCNSTNTKFCYYNNYSLSQPRYFCKTCRRYWTQGGSLRNVPVGGSSRKHKRSSPSPSPTTSSSQALSKMIMVNGGQDLNLAYNNPAPAAPTHHQNYSNTGNTINMISNSSRGLISSLIMPPIPGSDLKTLYPTGLMFPLQELEPTLNFSLDYHQHQHHHGFGATATSSGYGSSSLQEVQGGTSSARLLFPVSDLLKEKVQSPSSTDLNEQKNLGHEQRDSSTTIGYNWNNNNRNNNNGMLSGGSW